MAVNYSPRIPARDVDNYINCPVPAVTSRRVVIVVARHLNLALLDHVTSQSFVGPVGQSLLRPCTNESCD